jgi:HlyD family secretion protein
MDIQRDSRKSWKRPVQFLGFLVLVGGLVAITVGSSRLKDAAPVLDESLLWIGTAERGEFIRQVRGNGILVPKVEWWISSPGDGLIDKIHIEAGELVTSGQVIFTLSNPILEQEVQDTKWRLQGAEAELKNQLAQLESQKLDREEAMVTVKAQLEVADMEAERDRLLYEGGISSKIQWDTSAAKQRELKIRLTLAEKRLDKLKDSSEAVLAVQRATVEQFVGLLALKEQQHQDLAVTSREPGLVKQVLIEEGQQVTTATSLAQMAQPNQLKAELKLPETQIRDVMIGQNVVIDTHNGLIEGIVERIDPAVLEGTIEVEVRLTSELPKGARPDLSIEGRIELDRRADVLHVERPISSRENAYMEIFKIAADERVARRTRVQLGRSSVTTIEILEGLEPGDRIILSDMSKYEGNDSIRLR